MLILKNKKHFMYAFMFLPFLAGCGAVDKDLSGGSDVDGVSSEAEISSTQVKSLISSMDRISFDTNSHALPNDSLLQRYAAALKAYKGNDLIFVIEGNCDRRGSHEYNKALGLRRAKSVFDYFIKNGVDRSMLRVISNSYDKPVSSGSTLQDLAKNRNVQVVAKIRK